MLCVCVCAGEMPQGCAVSGSDVADNARVQALRECGADVRLGHDAAHLAAVSAAAAAGAAAVVVVRFPP
jgi:UDP-N-acetylmuramate-alanine ligase